VPGRPPGGNCERCRPRGPVSRTVARDRLLPYVPRLLAEWDLQAPDSLWQTVDSTSCFVDISGFTALSERLARRGRVGAEELTEILNHVFSRMLGVAYAKGGSLLKFGGDALLLTFTRGDHAVLGAEAAVAMQAALREARTLPTSVGRINLRMSVGLHTGELLLFRVGDVHRELIVTGPAATATTEMEHAADAGEILVSPSTAARLPPAAVGAAKGPGHLLRTRKVVDGGPGPEPPRPVADDSVVRCIPRRLHDRLVDQSADSEHRVATIGFVKFQGVDDLLAARGPDATAEALDAVARSVQDAADDENVTFLASDVDANGGKMILAAGVPTAQEDDEGRMLRAARAIMSQELPLGVRVGVNTGHVFAADIGTEFRRTFTVMGDTVNLAARLMAAASAGQVLATAGTIDRSTTLFHTEALPPFMVKGKSQPVQALAVGTARGSRTSAYGSLPFLGRDDELGRLRQAFDSAADGHTGVVIVEGERGSGKTRMTAEFLAGLVDVPIFQAEGEPNGGAVPYLSLRAPLRAALGIDAVDPAEAGAQLVATVQAITPDLLPLLPLLAPVVDAELPDTPESSAVAEEFVRDQVANVLVSLLDAAYPAAVVMVFDDAHWFDESSGEICTRLAEVARTRPWLVCANRRPDLGGFAPEGDVVIHLGPLGHDALRDLVDAATEGAPLRPQEEQGVITRAGGNPLFLEELLNIVRSTDVWALPDSLDAIAMREIDSLPAPSRRVLRLASVLGRSFDAALLDELVAADHLELAGDPLVGLRGQLTGNRAGRLTFRHAVLQEAAYQSLPYRSRLALHLQAGTAIEGSATDLDRVAATLSYHFTEGQDWDRTWHYAPRAAAAARRAHAPGEASIHLERALAAARKLGTVDQVTVTAIQTELGETLVISGLYDRADAAFRSATRAAGDDLVERARIAERRGELLGEFQGHLTAAIRQVRSGRALLDGMPAPTVEGERIRAKLLAREATLRARQGKLAEAVRLSESASDLAESVGEMRALAMALGVLDTSLVELGRGQQATHMDRVLDLYSGLGDQIHVAITLGNLGGIAYFEGRWDGASDYFRKSAMAANTAGDLATAAIAQTNNGEICVTQGRVAEAIAMLAPALRTLESFGFPVATGTAMLHLGRARSLTGELDEGVALIEKAAALFDKVNVPIASLEAFARLAEVLYVGGRTQAANEALARARELDGALGESPLSALVDRMGVTLEADRDPDAARSLLGPARARAEELGASYDVLVLLRLEERLDPGSSSDAADELARQLGVVKLVALPVP
jgi:class 3 adenylate cyclase/tetratricopeptide (TPR) repeat protein